MAVKSNALGSDLDAVEFRGWHQNMSGFGLQNIFPKFWSWVAGLLPTRRLPALTPNYDAKKID
jgi:hypothetical protein